MRSTCSSTSCLVNGGVDLARNLEQRLQPGYLLLQIDRLPVARKLGFELHFRDASVDFQCSMAGVFRGITIGSGARRNPHSAGFGICPHTIPYTCWVMW